MPDFATLKPVQPDFNTLKPVAPVDHLNGLATVDTPLQTGSAGQALGSGSISSNIARIPNDIFGASQSIPGVAPITNSLVTAGKNIGLLAQGKNPNIPVDIPKTIGGYFQAGSLVAGAALPVATGATIAARIGQAALGYGALGGLAGAGNALEKGATPGGVGKSAAIGTAIGAAGGVVGQGITEGVAALKAPIKGVAAVAKDAQDINTIQETIAPKLTLKEQRLALAEGRILPGQDPTLFKGGTADQILPSDKQMQAAIAIKDNIPGAVSLKPSELYQAIETKTTEMAQALKPVMETTPVSQDTIYQITDAWEALKTKQSADPYLPHEANLEKLQNNFETEFLQKSKANNMNDLWDTRKAYDASVPLNVKSATINSSDALQAKKSIWIQNRSILNDAINNIQHGLGEISQKTFQEMNGMYEAQKGIQSSIKVLKEGAPSRLLQFAKNHKIITGAAAAGAAHITGLDKTVIGAVLR